MGLTKPLAPMNCMNFMFNLLGLKALLEKI